jgi:hypothetical protein
MSDVKDKGGGKTDWETHSLRYVVNAVNSAQTRQQKLWRQLAATRKTNGTIPVDWPLIEEFIESVRRTHSLMIDLETVGSEFEQKFGRTGRPRAKPARTPPKAAKKK